MRRRRFLWLGLASASALVVGGLTWRSFSEAISDAKARVRGRSEVFQSRFGDMEYAEAGEGRPVLMIHGTGGGFDQGLDFAKPLTSRWRVIAPSVRISTICLCERPLIREPGRRLRRLVGQDGD